MMIDACVLSNKPAMTMALADPLKAMVQMAFPGFTKHDLYGPSSARNTQYPEYKKSPVCMRCGADTIVHEIIGLVSCPRCNHEAPLDLTPRYALQTLGTEWGRRLSQNVWCHALHHRVLDHLRATPPEPPRADGAYRDAAPPRESTTLVVVVSDLRFPSELDFFRELARTNSAVEHTAVFLHRALPEGPLRNLHESEASTVLLSKSPHLHNHIFNQNLSLDDLRRTIDQLAIDIPSSRYTADT